VEAAALQFWGNAAKGAAIRPPVGWLSRSARRHISLGNLGGRVSEEFQTIESEVKNPTLEPKGRAPGRLSVTD